MTSLNMLKKHGFAINNCGFFMFNHKHEYLKLNDIRILNYYSLKYLYLETFVYDNIKKFLKIENFRNF